MAAFCVLYFLLISTGISFSYPASEGRTWPLLNKLQSVASRIQQTQVDAPSYAERLAVWNSLWDVPSQMEAPSSTPSPSPGFTNVCENFCPKWCRKGQTIGERECHYFCTNLCDKKLKESNPYIGNPDYEVVVSDFNFDLHDLNKDKVITKTEFARSEMVPQEEVDSLFSFVDANADGFIDKREYQGGPLLFTVQMAAELGAMANSNPVEPAKSQA